MVEVGHERSQDGSGSEGWAFRCQLTCRRERPLMPVGSVRTTLAADSPFGQRSRLRVLDSYFASAGELTASNAWMHVYKTLLWLDDRTHLAHIYDSNHMQPGGNFYQRAIRFTNALSRRLGVLPRQLGGSIDYLFRESVREMLRLEDVGESALPSHVAELAALEEADEAGLELESSQLITDISELLLEAGIGPAEALPLAARIEQRASAFFTVGKKRQNVLGEGFEDVLGILLERVAKVSPAKIRVRATVTELPGFRRAAPVAALGRSERAPRPDLAIVNGATTSAIITAKWSMRQDRETQFVHEFDAYTRLKIQPQPVHFVLVTNEFDAARLDNVARAQAETRGYIFHTIYHISPELLRETQGSQIGAVEGWITAGKINSLEDFLEYAHAAYGNGGA